MYSERYRRQRYLIKQWVKHLGKEITSKELTAQQDILRNQGYRNSTITGPLYVASEIMLRSNTDLCVMARTRRVVAELTAKTAAAFIKGTNEGTETLIEMDTHLEMVCDKWRTSPTVVMPHLIAIKELVGELIIIHAMQNLINNRTKENNHTQ